MMSKYTLGTIVGTALLGLAKSTSLGSQSKIKKGYLIEPTKFKVMIQYKLKQNKDLYNDNGDLNVGLAREFLFKKIKKELKKHDIEVLTIKRSKKENSALMLIGGNPTFTLPLDFNILDVRQVKDAYEKVIKKLIQPLGFTIVPDSFYKYSTNKNFAVDRENQPHWFEKFNPYIKKGILIYKNGKWNQYKPTMKTSKLRRR
jgi:hypothetical protein